jgi:ATP/maltotriose-dependent transcriptional regulator MalT
MADDSEQARSYEARSRAIYEEHGMTFQLVARALIPAGIEWMAGDLEAAERQLRRGHDELEAIGENELRLTIAATLAQVLYDQGRDDDAEAFARASKDAAAEDDIGSQVLWRSALAKVLARRDGDPAAGALVDEAVRLAATTDMLSLHGNAVLDRARVAALLNGGTPPPELVAEAVELFERKGDAASLRRVELELTGAGASASHA